MQWSPQEGETDGSGDLKVTSTPLIPFLARVALLEMWGFNLELN
jgi:hypothetical protein